MSILHPATQKRTVKADNNQAIPNAYVISSPSVTYKINPTTSTDPFSSKSNKYAESSRILVLAKDFGCHVKFGDSSISAATTSDTYVPPGFPMEFGIDSSKAYVRILESASAANVWVTELF